MNDFTYTEKERDDAFRAGCDAGRKTGFAIGQMEMLRGVLNEISADELATVSEVKDAILNRIEKLEESK